MVDDCAGIRRNEVLPVPHANQERATLPRDDNLVRLVDRNDHETIGPLHLGKSETHRGTEIVGFRVHLLDEMRQDLGVGVAPEGMPLACQAGLDRAKVLDDAVVNDGDLFAAIVMGMSVDVVRLTMCGPARVADAETTGVGYAARLERGCEFRHFSGLLQSEKFPVLDQGDAGRIVSAVLKPLQSIQNDGDAILMPDISDDSAHGSPL